MSASDVMLFNTMSVLFNLILLWSNVVSIAALPTFKLSELNVEPDVNAFAVTYITSPFLTLSPTSKLVETAQGVNCALATSA